MSAKKFYTVTLEVIHVIDGPMVWSAQCPFDEEELLDPLSVTCLTDGFKTKCKKCGSEWALIKGTNDRSHRLIRIPSLQAPAEAPSALPSPRYDPEGRLLVSSTPSPKVLEIVADHVQRLLQDLGNYALETKQLGEMPLRENGPIFGETPSELPRPNPLAKRTSFLGFASPSSVPIPNPFNHPLLNSWDRPFKPTRIPPLGSSYAEINGYRDLPEGVPRMNPVTLLNEEEKTLCEIFHSLVDLIETTTEEHLRPWKQSAQAFAADPVFRKAYELKDAEAHAVKTSLRKLSAATDGLPRTQNPFPVGSIQWFAGAFPTKNLEKLIEILEERQSVLLAGALAKIEAAKTVDGLKGKKT